MKWKRNSFGDYESTCGRFVISKTSGGFTLHDKDGKVESYRTLRDAQSIANRISKPFKIGASHSIA
jgi:hypothetical protein